MKPHLAPYAKILTQASDRIFLKPVWLGPDLDRDAANTLYLISAKGKPLVAGSYYSVLSVILEPSN